MVNILLIEPDKVLAGKIGLYFANAKHKVLVHSDLQQAVISADKYKIAAVITEFQLAGRSGAEFLYEFRSYPDWQAVPVIIYSNLSPEELDTYSSTFDDLHIYKILSKHRTSLAELLQTVDQSLKTKVG